MFTFTYKFSPHLKNCFRNVPTHKLYTVQLNTLSVSALKPTSENAKDESFTVNYLIKRCGFAPEKAISASRYVNFDTRPDKPDVVIAFLKNQGFSETQILKLIRTFPPVVLCDPEKILLPKIEFFLSYGVSKADMVALLVAVPVIFRSSLDRNIIPTFKWLEKYLGSSEKATTSITRFPRLWWGYQRNVFCNIEILQQAGVPEHIIRNALTSGWTSFAYHPDILKKVVEEVRKIGVDPVKSTFVIAVHVKLSLGFAWRNKMQVYKGWGCSEDEVLAAFVTNPWCMAVSKDKIDGIMGFFLNEMGWNPSMLLQSSVILSLSLKRRIIPRCSVYQFLVSKGLIKKHSSLWSVLKIPEEKFLTSYVKRFEEHASELLKLYKEKLEDRM